MYEEIQMSMFCCFGKEESVDVEHAVRMCPIPILIKGPRGEVRYANAAARESLPDAFGALLLSSQDDNVRRERTRTIVGPLPVLFHSVSSSKAFDDDVANEHALRLLPPNVRDLMPTVKDDEKEKEGEECRNGSVGNVYEVLTEPSRRDTTIVYVTDLSDARTMTDAAAVRVTARQSLTLHGLFPNHVVKHMVKERRSSDSLARVHRNAAILFADIVGFTAMAKDVAPDLVMRYLNELFTVFDALCEKHGVHKLETAGDCYIVSSGVLGRRNSRGQRDVLVASDAPASCQSAVAFAKDMMTAAANTPMPGGKGTVLRTGIHVGDCVSGVIGNALPKFALFGDAMNTASRMESTCVPGGIQISQAAFDLLPPAERALWAPTSASVKGKGRMATYTYYCAQKKKNERLSPIDGLLHVARIIIADARPRSFPDRSSFVVEGRGGGRNRSKSLDLLKEIE